MSVTETKWILKNDTKAIEQAKREGWTVKAVESHHGHYSVLATREVKP